MEVTYSHVRYCKDSKLTEFFERKRQAKGTKKAAVAAARRLLEVIYHMLKRKEAYHAH